MDMLTYCEHIKEAKYACIVKGSTRNIYMIFEMHNIMHFWYVFVRTGNMTTLQPWTSKPPVNTSPHMPKLKHNIYSKHIQKYINKLQKKQLEMSSIELCLFK